jgi:hypothetical protein
LHIKFVRLLLHSGERDGRFVTKKVVKLFTHSSAILRTSGREVTSLPSATYWLRTAPRSLTNGSRGGVHFQVKRAVSCGSMCGRAEAKRWGQCQLGRCLAQTLVPFHVKACDQDLLRWATCPTKLR